MKLQIPFEYDVNGRIIPTRLEYENPIYDVLIGTEWIRFIKDGDTFILKQNQVPIIMSDDIKDAIVARLEDLYNNRMIN